MFRWGRLGFFQTLLMSFAAAFIAFFSATFAGIVSLLVYMTATSKHPDFAVTYKYFGLPAGLVVLVCALGYLGGLWVRRKLRKA